MKVHLVGCSVRALAEAVASRGWDVVSWDRYADRDTAEIGHTHLLDRSRGIGELKNKILPGDIVVPAGGMENDSESWKWLEDHTRFLAPPLADVQRLRDPLWLQAECQRRHIPYPETSRFGEEFHGESAGYADVPRLRKTSSSAGGLGVSWADNAREVGRNNHGVDHLGGDDRPVYRQRFIAGWSVSCSAVCLPGEPPRCTGWAGALPAEGSGNQREFLYRGSLIIDDPPERYTRAFKEAAALLPPAKLPYLLGVDWIDDGEKLWLLEVNPRWCASMELHEMRCPGCIIDALLGQSGHSLADTDLAWNGILIKKILYADADMIVDKLLSDQLMAMRERRKIGDATFRFADIPWPDQRFDTGAPICTVLVSVPPEA